MQSVERIQSKYRSLPVRSMWAWFAAALLFTASINGEEPEVIVELRTNRIFEGDSVRYYVLLNHCDNSAVPVMPKVPGVQFRHVRVSVLHQSTFDGFKRVTFGGPQHEYELTPEKSGEIEIPGPTFEVNGKTYRGETLKLEVVPPTEQDLALVEVTPSKSSVYPLQPFQLRLTVALKAIPEPHADKEPLRGVGTIPLLTIPWADDESLPAGMDADGRWLEDLLDGGRRPMGFAIKDVRFGGSGLSGLPAAGLGGMGIGGLSGRGGPDPFGLFGESQRPLFHPKPQQTKRKDSAGQSVEYWEYQFERTFKSSNVGSVSFGPVTLKGSFASRVNSAGEVTVDNVYAVAKPITVEVRGAPEEGQPSNYIGAVGRFNVVGQLSPKSVKVGDPMTFSLRLRGEGNLADATPPKLEQTPTIAESFKVYEATEESTDGERLFKYSLRPKKAGIAEFPAIELAYFDFDQEKFVNLRTEPIPIQVAHADQLNSQDIAVASSPSAANASKFEANTSGIFANITDLRRVRDERVRPDRWFLALAAMAVAFIVFRLGAKHFDRRRNDPLYLRRRSAVKNGEASLAESKRLAATGARRETVEMLSGALIRLISDAVGRSEMGLTSGDIARELSALGVSQRLIARCQKQFAEFDATKYGDATHPLPEQVATTEQLFSDLVREFRQRKLPV